MTNNDLMKVLLQINKAKKSKDAAFILAGITILTIGIGIHLYLKKKTILEDYTQLSKKYQSLIKSQESSVAKKVEKNAENSVVITESPVSKKVEEKKSTKAV
jgi:hypothetical protein